MPRPASPLRGPALDASLPISVSDVRAAAARIAPYIDTTPTPARRYPALDRLVGHGISVVVKHEHMLPTGAFKVRNGLSAVTALSPEARARGIVGASTGNHGLGLAYAGAQLGCAVTICVPQGNNPAKNAAIRDLGATLHEEGSTYDDAILAAQRLVAERGATMVHGVNDPAVIAGAGTLTLELLAQDPAIDTLMIAIGGGSQAVGALAVANGLGVPLSVIGVASTGAPTQHDAWHAGERVPPNQPVTTFAEGIATRATYDLTWPALRDGLSDFVALPDDAIVAGMRALLSVTRQLPEGAAGAGLAGLLALAPQLAGRRVGVVFCGGNADDAAIRRVIGS
ncbi:MAG: pyridoxal-phosphate dependent enzyme [Gemmatimonadaceae bacterium]|nr:pyridoxal-phosphate dependent enzyme [Gemmatimonadaceae bacterium]